jgi:hypothetical protein
LTLSKFFHSPTDAQVNCLKTNFKIYIKIDTTTAPTCCGAVTPSSGSTLLTLDKVTVAVVTLASTSNALPDEGVTAPKHVRTVLMSILM